MTAPGSMAVESSPTSSPVSETGTSSRSARRAVIASSVEERFSESSATCSASSLRSSSTAARRFWLMSTKVVRKIASTEAIIPSMTKVGSHGAMPDTRPRFTRIQPP